MILTFCSLDLLILFIWYFKDPIKLDIKTFPLIDPDTSIIDEDIRVSVILFCDQDLIDSDIYIWINFRVVE